MRTVETHLGAVKIVEDASELPDLTGAKEMFLDVETTSEQTYEEAFTPYIGNKIAGLAVTVDDCEHAWYVPYRHRRLKGSNPGNLNPDKVKLWLGDLPPEVEWINHNVNFDAHFTKADGHKHTGRKIDTTVLCKLINSDRFEHGLKSLGRDWLGHDMDEEDEVKNYLANLGEGNSKAKDYGLLPIELAGRYAGMDVLVNRELYRFCCWKKEESFAELWETEIDLTSVLFDMECEGMQSNQIEVKIEAARSVWQFCRCTTG